MEILKQQLQRSGIFVRHALRKKCPNSDFFWPVFSGIWTEYGKIQNRKNSNADSFHTVARVTDGDVVMVMHAYYVSDKTASHQTKTSAEIDILILLLQRFSSQSVLLTSEEKLNMKCIPKYWILNVQRKN